MFEKSLQITEYDGLTLKKYIKQVTDNLSMSLKIADSIIKNIATTLIFNNIDYSDLIKLFNYQSENIDNMNDDDLRFEFWRDSYEIFCDKYNIKCSELRSWIYRRNLSDFNICNVMKLWLKHHLQKSILYYLTISFIEISQLYI